MALLGTLEYMQEKYVYMESSFVIGSRQLILVSETDLEKEEQSLERRTERYYKGGGILKEEYLIGILDPVRKKQLGSIPVLNLVYREINEIVRLSKMERTYTHELGLDTYVHGNSKVVMQGTIFKKLSLSTDSIKLEASDIPKLNIRPRALGKRLVDIGNSGGVKYNTSTFLDASLEYLQRQGFDTSWVDEKDYIPIHTMADYRRLFIPALIREYKRWDIEKDFPYFLISMDFESDGLDAYCKLHPNPSKAVYVSISFKDNQSFGIFIDMENFDNVDTQELAKELTYLTQIDPIYDRDIILEAEGERLEVKRSAFTVTAHNMMIDRRFGMTIEADIWFDLCTLQLSFNLDPFMTTGNNGLKHIVNKFFGIEYAELRDICGSKNMGMFRYLTDKRVIMMYGCADTDWHRLAAKRLISIAREAKDYYGVDHAEQHMKLDALHLNHTADNDFQGHRVNYAAFEKEYNEKVRILNLYYSFMAQYVGQVKVYNEYEQLVVNAERYQIELESIDLASLNNAPPVLVDKWSGKELLDIIFKVLNYPVLVKTKQNKKAQLQGKAFKPKPAINTDALKYYLQFESSITEEQLEEGFKNNKSLAALKWDKMYLKEDFIDPVTGKVLISKKTFNSYRLPFMYVLLVISPLMKSISAELRPVVESKSEYRFSHCNPTSAVTRRILNPMQTVSKSSKMNYIPYDDDYYYCAVDQAAVEIRILYGQSKDEALILPLNNPEKDSHTETASLMYQRPAYTITKSARKDVKEIAFGIPYGKQEYATCISLFGEINPDNMAKTNYLFQLYNDKLASVMKVLNKVRDEMDVPVAPPESLKEYLEFDPEKNYGRMINAFGYCQHLEIRPDEEWFRQALRRKAGNFIIQGFASNLLRKIYVRMLKAMWRKGWIQNRMVRIHLTVHDEIDMSYHKSLNPVELMTLLHESLTVKIAGFPTFYVGINFGRSWGEAKKDESELPVLLVSELVKEYKEGVYDDYEFGDHIEFFNAKRFDYYNRRIHKELKDINKNRNIWDLIHLNDAFENYSVRSLVPAVVGENNGLVTIPKGSEDPVLFMAAYLPKFIAQYVLDKDNRNHYLVHKSKSLKITKDLLDAKFETLEDLFNNNPLTEESIPLTSFSVNSQSELLEDELELDLEDVMDEFGFDFDEAPIDTDEYAVDGIENLNTGFLNSYSNFQTAKDTLKEYGSLQERVEAEAEEEAAKLIQFNNFKVMNGKIILKVLSTNRVTQIRMFCRGNTTSSPSGLHLYVSRGTSLTNLNKYTVEFLRTLDDYLTSLEEKKVGV